jgi:hypothetical protein
LIRIKQCHERKHDITVVEAHIAELTRDLHTTASKKDHRSTLWKVAASMPIVKSIAAAKALLEVLKYESDISIMQQHENAIESEAIKKIYDKHKKLLAGQETLWHGVSTP